MSCTDKAATAVAAVSNAEKWAEAYGKFIDTPPGPGDILAAPAGEMARLDVEAVEGQEPFIYARAFVPSVIGCQLGWYLQPMSADKASGWKCILTPKSRDQIIRSKGLGKKRVPVKSLKVVKKSSSGKSLIVEINELD